MNFLEKSQISPKGKSFGANSHLTSQMNYKQRANVLFDKLNSFKTNMQNEKHQKFSELQEELKKVQTNLSLTVKEKQLHFDNILLSINSLDKQINHQKNEYNRFAKVLQNTIQSTNRECQCVFDKMKKEQENNQLGIEKYIDFKVESFILKNKGVWLEQDLLNFQPFKEELIYLKKEVQDFYKNQFKQLEKLKKQISETLDRQKEFLLGEMKRTDHQDIMMAIEEVYAQMTKKVAVMSQKRDVVQKNVLSMIENVVDSYIKDTNKFK